MLDMVSRQVVAGLERRQPGPWDVCPGNAPALNEPLLGSCPSLSVAMAALEAAGYVPTADYVPAAAIADTHDMGTMLKFAGPQGSTLLVARRVVS